MEKVMITILTARKKKTGVSTRRTTRFYALHYASLRGRDAAY